MDLINSMVISMNFHLSVRILLNHEGQNFNFQLKLYKLSLKLIQPVLNLKLVYFFFLFFKFG